MGCSVSVSVSVAGHRTTPTRAAAASATGPIFEAEIRQEHGDHHGDPGGGVLPAGVPVDIHTAMRRAKIERKNGADSANGVGVEWTEIAWSGTGDYRQLPDAGVFDGERA